MARRSRLNYTTELKSKIWDKYQQGLCQIKGGFDGHAQIL